MRLVTHQPWRRPLVIGITVVIALVCLLVGFALGQNKVVRSAIESNSLNSALERERRRANELEAQLIDAQLVSNVHKGAGDELREEMQSLRRQISNLDEEVTFYKSLMAPGEVQQGLQIDGLEVKPGLEGHFVFELLLTQIALRRSYIGGEVRIDVVGLDEDKTQVVKSLTELGYDQAYPLKFRFRYFQDLVGSFTLAEGFTPETILITVKQSGKDELQMSFPWALD